MNRLKSEHCISVEHQDDLLLARMDARLIVQVLINLVDNAIKYTQKGSHITVKTKREGERAVICVMDDGPGIEHKDQVFDMFYCGTNEVVDSRRSMGLGLCLCLSLIHIFKIAYSVRVSFTGRS